MKKSAKIILWVVLGFIAIQFIPVNQKNTPIDEKQNFTTITHAPKTINNLLRNSCYDCHSFETIYPNYGYIAPVSWAIKQHVNEGRKHANFSTWGKYNPILKKDILEKTIDAIQTQEMPMPAYVNYHEKARLSNSDRELLIQYFKQLLKSGEY